MTDLLSAGTRQIYLCREEARQSSISGKVQFIQSPLLYAHKKNGVCHCLVFPFAAFNLKYLTYMKVTLYSRNKKNIQLAFSFI